MDLERTIQTGTAVGIAILGVDSFHNFLPSVADIRKATPGDQDIRADVHAGELIAGITIAIVSGLAASVSGTSTPLVIGGCAFVAMFASYEWLLRSNQPFQGS